MDISPVLNEWALAIGVLTPFVTAAVTAGIMKIREADEWVRGVVSVIAVAVAALLVTVSQEAATEFSLVVDQGSGILAVHIASWLMLTKTAVSRFLEFCDRVKAHGVRATLGR